jgi:hypothetical protein
MAQVMRALDWIFFALFKADLSNSGKEYNKWKAVLGLSVLQGFLLTSADLWAKMVLERSYFLGLPRPAILAVGLILVSANYYAFLHFDRADRIVATLSNAKPRSKVIGYAAAWSAILGVLALLVFSFWRFSLWAPAHR